MNIENHIFGDGQASPLGNDDQEQQQEDDFYFIDKMESFWDKIDYDLLEKIVNK